MNCTFLTAYPELLLKAGTRNFTFCFFTCLGIRVTSDLCSSVFGPAQAVLPPGQLRAPGVQLSHWHDDEQADVLPGAKPAACALH